MSDIIIHPNEAVLKGELKNLVRNSVEKTLNNGFMMVLHAHQPLNLRPAFDR